ncbi:hypothetical protein Misp01_07770 [Microtetraspora sp. NBRC 13810]|uniref:hypothetical protein n=1 Tax=Microtetraspora sp. NBRC 13810 TaxID=3030990 RepID=UPI0024A335C2|nr:hypothetical protein [Microtetraspora sp. NBRC 13810]GLW05647.1 hypothetical protein Misp01_07770 [Microtetraspora sp. NBRC 13810]
MPVSQVGPVPPAAPAGTTQLRVHGVGGTRPQRLLGDPAPRQVAGDAIAGFYRSDDPRKRHVEAYSWGGLTSRSATRVLWLLLLPFMLANLAGWMCPARLLERPRSFRIYRAVMRWAALAVTLNLILLVTWIPLDYLGYQCGGMASCAGRWWPLQPFRAEAVAAFPARRLLLGAAVPLAVIALLAYLTYRSVRRYETVLPPAATRAARRPSRSGAALRDGLAHRDFWNGRRSAWRLGCAHIGGSLALVAALVTHTAQASAQHAGHVEREALRPAALALAAAVLLAALALLAADERRAGHPGARRRWTEWPELGLPPAGAVAVALAAIFAWSQPAARAAAGEPPGMGQAVAAAYTAIAALIALIPFVLLLGTATRAGLRLRLAGSACAAAATAGLLLLLDSTSLSHPYPWAVAALAVALGVALAGRAARRRGFEGFRWAAPFVVLALGVALLNTVGLGLLIRLADTVGNIEYADSTAESVAGQPGIAVFAGVQQTAPYLILVPAGALLLCLCRQLVLYGKAWLTGYAEVRREYLALEAAQPAPERARVWMASAVRGPGDPGIPGDPGDPGDFTDPAPDGPVGCGRWRGRRWAARVAAVRRLGRATLDLDLLLTTTVTLWAFLLGRLVWRAWTAPVSPWLTDAGTTAAAALPALLLGLLSSGWRDFDRRRNIAVLWDVGTFWPRSYHPLAPPSYAERAVPDLQRRMWWLHDNGGKVVLVAHSQGSVLAAAALVQRDCRPPDDTVALVTFGSPLHKLYGWAFPAYFGARELGEVAALRVPYWKNLYYLTDFIGGPVRADGCADVELPDPRTSLFLYGDPPPAIRGHSGYWQDPALWTVVEEATASLRAAPAENGAVSQVRTS